METPAQRCTRLAAALDDLAAQEAAALAAGDFDTVLALQDRAAPLVEFLAARAGEIARHAPLAAALAAVQARRGRSAAHLAAAIARARGELAEAGAARRRVARIAPAYGRGPASASQLCAVG
jgi:hypothetical protein